MGRHIYADEVGSTEDDKHNWVHKFWFAVQPSDVDDYLEAYEPGWLLADLEVSQKADIKAKVAELKVEFKKTYGVAYKNYEPANDIDGMEKEKAMQQLAARIDLGEHLLATIKNMKKQGIDSQQLTIEC